MPPPKRKGTGTPEEAESSAKRQELSVPSPPSLTNSAGQTPTGHTPPRQRAFTPPEGGTRQTSGRLGRSRDPNGDYTWRQCWVTEDTFGEKENPVMHVVVEDDEDPLPIWGNPREMDLGLQVANRDKNWKGELVTVHFRLDIQNTHRRNHHFEPTHTFLGPEGYPKGEDDFNNSDIRTRAQGPATTNNFLGPFHFPGPS